MPTETIGGPYLGVAVLCEKVLREADGVISLIRIVDRWNITGNTPEMPLSILRFTIVVMMKSGIHRGTARLTITPISPSGAAMPAIGSSVFFEGDDDRGIAAIVPIGFPAQESGVYWFDVAVDDQTFTRVPLRVVYQCNGPGNPSR